MVLPKKFFIFNHFPHQKKYIHVDWNEVVTGKDPDVIGTDGVSCCLVITLYDPSTKRGVLSHIMDFFDSPIECKAENIIDTMLKAIDLTPNSPNLSSLEATLSGESDIDFLPSTSKSDTVKSILARYNIPIIGEDLGEITDEIEYFLFTPISTPGRLVFLHHETGIVEVYRA